METRIARLEQRVSQLEKEHSEMKEVIEPIKEDNIRNDKHYKQIITTLNEVKNDVKELKNRPSKFLDYIYMTVISAVISFIITKFGG